MRLVLPEPINRHYVVIDRRRYPPKQVVEVITGLDRADFTSHQARRILTGLGFPAGRRPGQDSLDRPGSTRSRRRGPNEPIRPTAETLEPFIGLWVATEGQDVIVAAEDPHAVVNWLAEHRKQADSMFRVPADELQASGLAPL